jgi:hypothetical protein
MSSRKWRSLPTCKTGCQSWRKWVCISTNPMIWTTRSRTWETLDAQQTAHTSAIVLTMARHIPSSVRVCFCFCEFVFLLKRGGQASCPVLPSHHLLMLHAASVLSCEAVTICCASIDICHQHQVPQTTQQSKAVEQTSTCLPCSGIDDPPDLRTLATTARKPPPRASTAPDAHSNSKVKRSLCQ